VRTFFIGLVVLTGCGEPGVPPQEPRPRPASAPRPTPTSAPSVSVALPAPKRVVPFAWRTGKQGAMATLIGAGEEFFATVAPDNEPRLGYVTSPFGNTASPRLVLPQSSLEPELAKLGTAIQACWRAALAKDDALTGSMHVLVRATLGLPQELSASGDAALEVLAPCLNEAFAGVIYPEDGDAWLAFPLTFTP
jgi:hypothetical protein